MMTSERLAEIRGIRTEYERWLQQGREGHCPESVARSIAIEHVGHDALDAVGELMAELEELQIAVYGRRM